MNLQQTIGRLSKRYQVSAEAVSTLAEAMRRGGNRMAQFNHPDLGGHGQWLPGMTQIGDMFNRDLRGRVEGLCADLSSAIDAAGEEEPSASMLPATHGDRRAVHNLPAMKPMEPMKPMKPLHGFDNGPAERWWPENLGDSPDSAGGQNEMRYAYFADKDRLAIDAGGGKITVYDTAGHQVSGVQQRQSGGTKKMVFSSERGEMDLGALKQV